MPLTVPAHHLETFKKWLTLRGEEANEFLGVIEESGPQFNASALAESISSRSQLPFGLVASMIQILISMRRTIEDDEPIDGFLDDKLRPTLVAAKVFTPEREQDEWEKLRSFLLPALSFEQTIGATSKAGYVLTEHERIFQDVRIMSDIRPIFHTNVAEKPNAALVVHMMRITERNQYGEKSDFYFALDTNDVAKMRHALERAAEKEKTIREAMKDSGISILDVQTNY